MVVWLISGRKLKLDLKAGWIASLQQMITMLEERVKQVELKGKSFSCIPPATDEEVIEFEREVNQIDPIIVMGQYQQQHMKRAERYKQFIGILDVFMSELTHMNHIFPTYYELSEHNVFI